MYAVVQGVWCDGRWHQIHCDARRAGVPGNRGGSTDRFVATVGCWAPICGNLMVPAGSSGSLRVCHVLRIYHDRWMCVALGISASMWMCAESIRCGTSNGPWAICCGVCSASMVCNGLCVGGTLCRSVVVYGSSWMLKGRKRCVKLYGGGVLGACSTRPG